MSKSSEKIDYPFDPIPLEFLRSKKVPPQIKLFLPIFRSFIHRGNEPDFNTGQSLKGYGFPSNKTLAEVSGYSVSYIKYIKRIFKKMDLIKLIKRDGTSSLYVVKSYELILQELEKGDDYKKMFNKFSDEVSVPLN